MGSQNRFRLRLPVEKKKNNKIRVLCKETSFEIGIAVSSRFTSLNLRVFYCLLIGVTLHRAIGKLVGNLGRAINREVVRFLYE